MVTLVRYWAIILLFISFFTCFSFITIRWYSYSKTFCSKKPMLISTSLRDEFSRSVVAFLLISSAIFSLFIVHPINIDIILLFLVFLCLGSAFVFYQDFVHEVFVICGILFALLSIFKVSRSSWLYFILKYMTIFLFIVFLLYYFAEYNQNIICTYNGFVEYTLLGIIFLTLLIKHYTKIKYYQKQGKF